jgi:hypothetical protein
MEATGESVKDVEFYRRQSMNSTASTGGLQLGLIEGLLIQDSQQHRIVILVVAALSLVASVLVIGHVLYETGSEKGVSSGPRYGLYNLLRDCSLMRWI